MTELVSTTQDIPNSASPADDINTRLTHITRMIRKYADQVKRNGETATKLSSDTYEALNRQKGGIIAEALVFQAQSPQEPFFTALVEEGEDPIVVFTIPDKNHPRGHLRTKTKVSNIRLPGAIETSADAIAYINTQPGSHNQEPVTENKADELLTETPPEEDVQGALPTKELPKVNLTSQQLLELGQKIEFIDGYRITANKNPTHEEIQSKWKQFRKLKHDFLLEKVLPARRGKLPNGINIIVDRLKDVSEKSERDRIRIVIRSNKHAFKTLLYTGEMQEQTREEIMWLIGDFDHEYEFEFDSEEQKPSRK